MILATVLICAAFLGLALIIDQSDRFDDPIPDERETRP